MRLCVKGRVRGVPSNWVLWSFFPLFVNVLLPGNLSVLLQNRSVQSEDGAEQTLCYVARACPWRAVKVGHVVFFSIVCEQTPPREFVRSTSKLVSTVRRWCWTNDVLYATVRQRACPWRVVKVAILNQMSNCHAICAIP